MKWQILTILILFSVWKDTDAQSPFKFHSQNYTGWLEGERGSAFQLQSINGFQYKTWFAGLGTGLDYYKYRTVPLFLSVSRYLSPEKRAFFLSLDGGVNFLWDDEVRKNSWASRDFDPSLYWSGGVGYKMGLKNSNDALLLSVGYSAKYLNETQESPIYCINPPCPNSVETYHYNLKRLSLKLGWQF